MRCWWCGAVPDDVEAIHAAETAEPVYLVLGWDRPGDGHQHALKPPGLTDVDARFLELLDEFMDTNDAVLRRLADG